MKASNGGSICFGVFEFDPQAHELRKRGLKVRVGPQACKVLALLLEYPGRVRTMRGTTPATMADGHLC
jgi:DNA-binding winged helix-turn-helix (wHTH) protein